MKVRTLFRGPLGRSLALLTGLLLVADGAPRTFAQSSTSTIAGVIVDPTGVPAKGFKVVFRDVASNTRYTSTSTDAAGNYLVEVEPGGRYKIENVIADDGVTKLPVEDVPAVSALAAGTLRVNVRFISGQAPAAQTVGGTRATEEKKQQGDAPWYQKPGPIIGIVLGVGVIGMFALTGGSSEASPFTPPPADR